MKTQRLRIQFTIFALKFAIAVNFVRIYFFIPWLSYCICQFLRYRHQISWIWTWKSVCKCRLDFFYFNIFPGHVSRPGTSLLGRCVRVCVCVGGGGGSQPSNNFYVRKLVKITSRVGQNRKLVPCCKKYNKRVNFGETFYFENRLKN